MLTVCKKLTINKYIASINEIILLKWITFSSLINLPKAIQLTHEKIIYFNYNKNVKVIIINCFNFI